MPFLGTKSKTWYRRVLEFMVYGTGQVLPRLFTLVVSWILIKDHSSAFWGEFVKIMILVNLTLVFTGFGNYQYLLKQFSAKPKDTHLLWCESLQNRGFLLLPIYLIIGLLNLSIGLKLVIMAWVTVIFLNQSFQILLVFNKHFNTSIFAEMLAGLVLLFLIITFSEGIDIYWLAMIFVTAHFCRFLIYLIRYYKMISLSIFRKPEPSYFNHSLPFFAINLTGTLRSQADLYMVAVLLTSSALGQYHILVSLMALAETGVSYVITPSLKLFYRTRRSRMKSIKRVAMAYGVPLGIFATLFIYLLLVHYYEFSFPAWYYPGVFLFIWPQMLKIIVVNDLFAQNKQFQMTKLAVGTTIVQVVVGWFLISYMGLTGAVLVKIISFIIHFLILYFVIDITKAKEIDS